MTERGATRKRIGSGPKLLAFAAVLVAVFAVASIAGGAIDPDQAAEGSDRSHSEEDEMNTMAADEHGAGAAPAGLAIAADGYRLDIDRDDFAAAERGELSFRIVGPDGVVTDFEEEHRKPLHLIVVRRDLTGFQHLHPRMAADGTWSAPLELAEAGVYRAYADFRTAGHELTLGADLTASGEFQPLPLPAPQPTATTAGYEVTREDGGEEGMLAFTVRRGGEPVPDLQPYLGARGHLVAIRAGDLAYVHVHPEEADPGDPATIAFHAQLPSAGSYRLFLQFRHRDEVRTVAFTGEVSK